MPEVVKAYLR
jgi:hypothetical protein